MNLYGQAVASVPQLQIQIFPITQALVETARALCQKHELLTGDALVVAVMQTTGLIRIASLDDDFDRVPGITRYAPV